MSDKVGIRIDLLYLNEAQKLCEIIRSQTDNLEIIKEDKKLQSLGSNRLGYLGVNFDVIPKRLPKRLHREKAKCEIQIRTFAQSAWAMAAHELVYKAPVEPKKAEQRRIYRLMALMEIFDEQVSTVRDRIIKQSDYAISMLLEALESELVKFTAPTFDDILSKIILQNLVEDITLLSIQTLTHNIENWVLRNENKLNELYSHYTDDDRNPLLHQPEALFIFFSLDNGERYSLIDKWSNNDLPRSELESLAQIWGSSIP